MPRLIGWAACGLLVVLGLAHAQLLGTVLLGQGSEPPIIVAGHFVCLGLATAGAAACWNRRPWAWKLVATYGVAIAALILALGPALRLPAEARAGLWAGAGASLVLFAAGAWLLRLSLGANRT